MEYCDDPVPTGLLTKRRVVDFCLQLTYSISLRKVGYGQSRCILAYIHRKYPFFFRTTSLRLIWKNDVCRPKLRCKNAKEGRLLSMQQRGGGRGRLLLVAEYWWLTLISTHMHCTHTNLMWAITGLLQLPVAHFTRILPHPVRKVLRVCLSRATPPSTL